MRRAIWRSPARRRRSTADQAHRQFRRRDAVESSGPARVRQLARIPRRLRRAAAQPELRRRRARRRRNAARLLVQLGARLARAGRRREHRQAGRSARLAPTECTQAVDGHGAGACSCPSWRAVCSVISSARFAAAASIAARRSCSTPRASRSFRHGCRSPSVRTSARRWAARRSTAKASRPAIASWSSDGVLTGYVLSTYSARKLGLKTTGNAGGVHNLIVAQRRR